MEESIKDNLIVTEKVLEEVKDKKDSLSFAEWTKTKVVLRYNGKIPNFPIIDNFIYWANLGINIGSEQDKYRPVLVFNTSKKSKICTIIPLSTKRLKDEYWYHIDLTELDSTALVEQLKVISKIRIVKPFRLKGKIVSITENDWIKINCQLEKQYRLKPLKKIE